MKIDPMQMMKMREQLMQFHSAHPKVLPFFQAVSADGIREGSVIEMKVTNPEGKSYVSSIRVTAQDMEMLREVMNQQRP